ncbi:hypothetical protein [Streptomyces griseosporeus]|uniref:hypothetical protein n=1 Tax=Streptomyces griseosporeus TaxID=1910 RepID=UPI0036F59389
MPLHRCLLGHAHHADALTLHGLAFRAIRRHGDTPAEARTLLDLGEVYYWWYSDFTQAADNYRQALSPASDTGDRSAESRARHHLGIADEDARIRPGRGAPPGIPRPVPRARRVLRAGEASSLTDLGVVHQRQGRHEEAHRLRCRSLRLNRENGSRIGETLR